MCCTGSVSLESRGHKRFCSLAAFSTLLTVVLDALQLRAILVWLRPNPANRMISRYLVINGDLLCNVFTLQSAWIHYKGNRYHLTGISVSDDQNCGIHQNGFAVLRFRNSGSESPGILNHPLVASYLMKDRFVDYASYPWVVEIIAVLGTSISINLICYTIDFIRLECFKKLHIRQRLDSFEQRVKEKYFS